MFKEKKNTQKLFAQKFSVNHIILHCTAKHLYLCYGISILLGESTTLIALMYKNSWNPLCNSINRPQSVKYILGYYCPINKSQMCLGSPWVFNKFLHFPHLEYTSLTSVTFNEVSTVRYKSFDWSCFSHLLSAREGSQGDVGLYIPLLVQSDHLRAGSLLPSGRSQVVDQFQCCWLVDGVRVGPVDTNLEGFLDGGGREGRDGGEERGGTMRGSGWEAIRWRIRKKMKSLSVMSDKILNY